MNPIDLDSSTRHLILHGAIVLFVGLMCGIPYGRAINTSADPRKVNAWRVAHASLPMGATLMLAVAALMPMLVVSSAVKWVLAGALITSSYAFCVSLPLAAVVGHCGLTADGPMTARWVHAGNVLGALASVVASLVLIYSAWLSI